MINQDNIFIIDNLQSEKYGGGFRVSMENKSERTFGYHRGIKDQLDSALLSIINRGVH